MLNINIGDSVYPIKNDIAELFIGEFENIASILNDQERNTIDKWCEILEYLGVPSDALDNFDIEDFVKVIQQFNIHDDLNLEFQKEIYLKDLPYVSFENEFKLNVKQLRLIEDYVTKNKSRYLGEMLAVIYKRPDIDKELHYDKSHLHFKAELIRKEIKASVAIPYLNFLSKRLIKDFELVSDETTS